MSLWLLVTRKQILVEVPRVHAPMCILQRNKALGENLQTNLVATAISLCNLAQGDDVSVTE